MGFFWERNLDGLPPEVAKERRRVLLLLQAHEGNFRELKSDSDSVFNASSHLFTRLVNMIAGGSDLEEEMKLPPEERVMGFHWPDE